MPAGPSPQFAAPDFYDHNNGISENLSFTYDAEDRRISKVFETVAVVDGETTKNTFTAKYSYVGDTLTDMQWIGVDGTKDSFHFTYDTTGPMSMTFYGAEYFYLKNAQGDITGFVDSNGTQVVAYTYDTWGNILSTTGSMADSLGVANPFRYHGYFYDTETGLYYLVDRYYNPQQGRFISTDSELAGASETVHGYNLFAYCHNNPVNMGDPDGNWPKWAKKIVAAAAIAIAVTVVAAITVATAGAGTAIACAAVGAAKGAIIGFAVGAVTGAVTGAVSNRIKTGSWRGSGKAALEGAADGALSGTISGAITGGLNSNACFIAGTTVVTATGYVAIESVRAGDKVWAEDPDTGKTELKEVIRTFVNETEELVHVSANGESITCTPEHPFYSPVKGWFAAIQLRAGDILVTVNGKYVIVEKIQHEILEAPVQVYNFEVTDFHTYFVGDTGVLVHNSCNHNSAWDSTRRQYWKEQAKIVREDVDYGAYKATMKNIERMASGKAPIGWDGYSVTLHHWKGIANDFYDFSPVTRTFHIYIHKYGGLIK